MSTKIDHTGTQLVTNPATKGLDAKSIPATLVEKAKGGTREMVEANKTAKGKYWVNGERFAFAGIPEIETPLQALEFVAGQGEVKKETFHSAPVVDALIDAGITPDASKDGKIKPMTTTVTGRAVLASLLVKLGVKVD